MDLIYLFNVLKRRMWLIAIIPIIAATAAFFVVYNAPKKYRSSAQLSTGLTTDVAVKLTDERFNIGRTDLKFSNLIEKINSEQVITLISYRLAVNDLTSESPFRTIEYEEKELVPPTQAEKEKMVKIFENKLESFEVLSSYDPEELKLIELLKLFNYNSYSLKESGLEVKRVGRTDFISVNFTSENPILSAFVVNSLCEEYIRYNKKQTSNTSEESVEFLSQLVEDKKKTLDETKSNLNTFKTSNQVTNYKLESELKIGQISEYQVKKQEEEDNIKGIRLAIQNLNNKIANSTTQTTNNTKILELRSRINQINQLYIDGGSNDKELENTINNLREQLQIEMSNMAAKNPADGSSLEALKAEREDYQLKLDIAISNLASLNGSLGRLRAQVSGFSSKESALSVLKQEVDNALKEYNNALSKYNEYKNKSLVSGTTIRQIKKGQPALDAESSKTIILTLLAGIVSMFLCVALIVFTEVIDTRIKTVSQFEKATKLGLSGFINKINTKKLILKELFVDDDHSKDLTKFKQLLRKIRFELESMDASTVLVTSPKVGEGKTFVIMCLAYSLSLIKKRVLIIDTNFKNNSLTNLLMVKPNFQKAIEMESKVSTKLLLNQHEFEGQKKQSDTGIENDIEAEENIISKTAHQNIDIIGSKRGNSSPSEILSGRDFKGMIEVFKNDYDYVLMEGASLNEYPDTKELVEFVDVILPVFSADTSLKQVDRDSVKYLKSLNGKLMGSILNKVENQNLKN